MALGLVGALALGRVLWSLLYQVSAADPVTFAFGFGAGYRSRGAGLLPARAAGDGGRSGPCAAVGMIAGYGVSN